MGRIVVTGSLGALGRPLVSELRARGHDVYGCDTTHDPDPFYRRADVAHRRQLERVFEMANPDTVYHLAAEFGRINGEEYTEQLWPTAMIGTRNVLDLCAAADAHMIFASSSEIYGDHEADWLPETLAEREVLFHPNEYALSKWANERQIMSHVRRHDTHATRLRFFNTYGPGEPFHPYRSVVALFCHQALISGTLAVYRGYRRTFMHIDDFTPMLANVCEADLHYDVYNLGGTDFRSVEDLATMVVDHVGGGTIDVITEDRHNVRSKRPDISRALEDLGHVPAITLETGVPDTLRWMRAQLEPRLRLPSERP